MKKHHLEKFWTLRISGTDGLKSIYTRKSGRQKASISRVTKRKQKHQSRGQTHGSQCTFCLRKTRAPDDAILYLILDYPVHSSPVEPLTMYGPVKVECDTGPCYYAKQTCCVTPHFDLAFRPVPAPPTNFEINRGDLIGSDPGAMDSI